MHMSTFIYMNIRNIYACVRHINIDLQTRLLGTERNQDAASPL